MSGAHVACMTPHSHSQAGRAVFTGAHSPYKTSEATGPTHTHAICTLSTVLVTAAQHQPGITGQTCQLHCQLP